MYTVLMWDPDAVVPSYIHTLIINISKKSDGTIILPHTPPSPPPEQVDTVISPVFLNSLGLFPSAL
jgi:hypothetical protein